MIKVYQYKIVYKLIYIKDNNIQKNDFYMDLFLYKIFIKKINVKILSL